MPRGRKKLTDTQERILIQCQLMGLTTADMTQISNRLKALDVEREFKAHVSEISSGFTWSSKNKREFILTDIAGHVYTVKVTREYGRGNRWSNNYNDVASIDVSKPGTRFKQRSVQHPLKDDWNRIEIVSACPDNNKFLYRVMRDIKLGRFK